MSKPYITLCLHSLIVISGWNQPPWKTLVQVFPWFPHLEEMYKLYDTNIYLKYHIQE